MSGFVKGRESQVVHSIYVCSIFHEQSCYLRMSVLNCLVQWRSTIDIPNVHMRPEFDGKQSHHLDIFVLGCLVEWCGIVVQEIHICSKFCQKSNHLNVLTLDCLLEWCEFLTVH